MKSIYEFSLYFFIIRFNLPIHNFYKHNIYPNHLILLFNLTFFLKFIQFINSYLYVRNTYFHILYRY